MKPERMLLYVVIVLLAFVCTKFPAWGIIHLERKLDIYPLVSRDTVAMLDQMSATYADFDKACEVHRAAERDAMNGVAGYRVGFITTTPYDLIDAMTTEMYAAVDRRKILAAQADWGLIKSILVGGQGYTHSTWLCAPAYASNTTQINVGFTSTYDTPAY